MKIENLKNCSGCSSCFSVCPKQAITMIANQEGFKIPTINHKYCIKCKLCEQTCPQINFEKNHENEDIAYAFINENYNVREYSSSGGFFYKIGNYVLDHDGVVFGAKFSNDFSVVHSYCCSMEQLGDFMGSKYVQSNLGNSYRECKTFLDSNKLVLFTGTACQIEGLLNYLKKSYQNLITIDVVCHGVPSNKLWQQHLSFISNGRNLKTISFRDKKNGWRNYYITYEFNNGETLSLPWQKDLYFQIFQHNECFRDSCYVCSSKNRGISDFTIGDYWGVEELEPSCYDDLGTSIVIVKNEKALRLFEELSINSIVKKVELKDAIRRNRSILFPTERPKKRNGIYDDLDQKGIEYVYRKYGIDKSDVRFKRTIKIMMKKLLKI